MNIETAKQFHDRLSEALVRRLWDQWTVLGAPTSSKEVRGVPWMIDPEALILASLALAEHETRLRDVMIEWLAQHGSLINVARLKRIKSSHFPGVEEELGSIASTLLNHGKLPNWKTLLPRDSISDSSPPASSIRGLATKFDPHASPCLILKFRALLGVSSRAEILAYLLTLPHYQDSISGIAAETGWFSKTIQKAVVEMKSSGHVRTNQGVTSRAVAINPDDWSAFTGGQVMKWLQAPNLFEGHLQLLTSLKRIIRESPKPSVAHFLMAETYSEAANKIFGAVSFLCQEAYDSVDFEEEFENFVASAEEHKDWPVGCVRHNPSRTEFVAREEAAST